MYSDQEKARQILEQGGHTCVLCCEEEFYTDDRRGVRPLLDFLERSRDWHRFCAADKVVGKAAAFLYQLMGVRALYAQVVSEPAAKVLKEAGIQLTYGTMVSAIRNRTDTGFCPMETAVWDLIDPEEALPVLKVTLENLAKNAGS
ncbi:MAG: DUF1893 domain-containing protein [Oscillospiraceae bacterium]|nr:DUF1893 domain-containing protein [Oscillospiraceae bacterium]